MERAKDEEIYFDRRIGEIWILRMQAERIGEIEKYDSSIVIARYAP
jgi:hypothetical protein